MPPDRKEAAERLRQLVNSNFENEIAVSVNYDIFYGIRTKGTKQENHKTGWRNRLTGSGRTDTEESIQ